MDYGVRFDIITNGTSAAQSIQAFSDAVTKNFPKVISNLKSVNDELKKLQVNAKGLRTATSDVRALRAEINRLKSKSVTITTTNKTVNTVVNGGVSSSTASGSTTTQGGRSPRTGRVIGGHYRGIAPNNVFSPQSFLSGAGIPLLTLGGAAIFGRIIASLAGDAMKFSDTMTSVQNILKTSDTNLATFNSRFAKVSQNIQQVGIDTKFTSTQVAEAAKYLAMAGMDLETIDKSMRPIADIAAMADAPLDRIADVVTNIMAGYRIAASGMQGTADIITSIASSSNTSVLEMAEGFKFAAAHMNSANISFAESTAAMGLLANSGIKATVAGTALRAMMIRLVSPTARGAKTLDRLGVSLTRIVDGKEKMKSLHEIFSELRESGASIEDLYKIFDKVAGAASTAIFRDLETLKRLTLIAENAGGLAGYLAEQKMKTVVGLTQQITSQFEYLGQQAYMNIEPIIKVYMAELMEFLKSPAAMNLFMSIANGLASIVEGIIKVSKVIYNNWDWIKWLLGGYLIQSKVSGLFNAITGGLMSVASAGTAAGGAVKLTMGSLMSGMGAMLLNPATLIGGAVAAVGLLGIKLYDMRQEYSKAIEQLEKRIEFQTFDEFTDNLNTVSQSLTVVNEKVSEFLANSVKLAETKDSGLSGWLGAFTMWSHGITGTQKDYIASDIRSKGSESKFYTQTMESVKKQVYGDLSSDILQAERLIYGTTNTEERKKHLANIGSSISRYEYTSNAMRSITGIIPEIASGEAAQKDIEHTKEYYTSAASLLKEHREGMKNVVEKWDSGDVKNILTVLKGFGIIKDASMSAFTNTVTGQLDASRAAMAKEELLKKGFNIEDILAKFDILGIRDLLKTKPDQLETFQPRLTTDEGDEIGVALSGSRGGGSGLSGTSRMGRSGNKNIIVNITNLLNVENADLNGGDLNESFKQKIASALTDIVKDFEISYS